MAPDTAPNGDQDRSIVEWVDPRWFAQDFVNLYEQVKDTDPDIREEYHKWAHNARLWLEATAPLETRWSALAEAREHFWTTARATTSHVTPEQVAEQVARYLGVEHCPGAQDAT